MKCETCRLKKNRSEKLWERGFVSSGVFAAMIVIGGCRTDRRMADHDRTPVADPASADYRQRMIAQTVS
jgi:hypothetical protein